MKRETLLKEIISFLSVLQNEITLNNSISFYDKNIAAEDFFRDLLNLIYGYDLKNVNILSETNFPAIDLIDDVHKIAIQVSGDPSSKKIKQTISKFIKNKLYTKYNSLRFLFLKDKKKYSKEFDTGQLFEFDKSKHIRDFKELIKDIRGLKIEEIDKIHAFLEKELGKQENVSNSSIASEVETIMALIEYLSDEKNLENKEPVTYNDPEGKVYKRFADHSTFLIEEMQSYLPRYENKRVEVEKNLGLDSLKAQGIRTYLKYKSDEVLRNCKADPIKALNSLTTYFERCISKAGKKFDAGAIRYYLIYQIIACNVFPNLVKES